MHALDFSMIQPSRKAIYREAVRPIWSTHSTSSIFKEEKQKKSEVASEGRKELGRPNMSFWTIYLSHVRSFWAFAGAEILSLLQVQSFEARGRKSIAEGLKFWVEATTSKLSLGDFDRDHLLKGRANLVVGRGLCLGLRGLGCLILI